MMYRNHGVFDMQPDRSVYDSVVYNSQYDQRSLYLSVLLHSVSSVFYFIILFIVLFQM